MNPALVQAFGPGLENAKTNTPTHFNINCREAGPGELKVDMKTPDNHDLPISLTDNEDGTYTVDYVAPDPGTYTVNLNYGGLKVPKSPLKVNVQPRVDVSKVKVDGLANSKFLLLREHRRFSCVFTLVVDRIEWTSDFREVYAASNFETMRRRLY